MFPDSYELKRLVPLARKARARVVEFDWSFTEQDIRRLRETVFRWGRPAVGRYKAFDARVLVAINGVLGEPESMYSLDEPRRARHLDCSISCVVEGDMYRLSGHGPFDSVLGYCRAGVNTKWKDALGDTASRVLSSSAAMLQWDLERLQGEAFRPMWNVLYGLKPDYSVVAPRPSDGPPIELTVRFSGPYSVLGEPGAPSLFSSEVADRNGVYIWTVPISGQERPWYVGQTRRGFARRMGEHVGGFLAGEYRIHDTQALARGAYVQAPGSPQGRWPEALPQFVSNLPELLPSLIALIRALRFHVAVVDGDQHIYNRVEGAIGRYLMRQEGTGLMPGLKLPAAIPYDDPLRLSISADLPILGLASEILE